MTIESYTDTYIQQQVRVENLKEGEALKISSMLKKVHDDFIKKLGKTGGDWTAARYLEAIRTYQTAIQTTYEGKIVPSLRSDGVEFTNKSVAFNVATLEEVSGAAAVASPTTQAVFTAALSEPFDGRLFQQWTADLARKDVAIVSNELRASWVAGESIEQGAKRMAAVVPQAENHLKSVTRSYFSHLSAQTRDSVFEENDDLVEGQIWSSILDGRTTQDICAPRDQKVYTTGPNPQPIGHEFPWDSGPGRIHWNCRSLSLPKIVGVDETYQRVAIGPGEDYRQGDLKTDQGKVRKVRNYNASSTTTGHKAKGDEIFKIKTVNTATDYEKWMARQPQKFQNDALGVRRAKAFRSGEWSYGQPFRAQNPTTIENF
jgi:hypothetical protein